MTSQLKEVGKDAYHVSFLDFTSKKKDWRYETCQRLLRNQQQSETIYWIGSIDLRELDANTKTVTVTYLELEAGGAGLSTVGDSYYERYEDGGQVHKGIRNLYNYSVTDPDLKAELLAAQSQGHNFFHFCAEETVDRFGDHVVYLIYNVQKEEGDPETVRGLGSKKSLRKESLNFYSKLAFGYISEKTERLPLLSHDSYRWHK